MQSFNDDNACIDVIAAKIAMDQVIRRQGDARIPFGRPAPWQRKYPSIEQAVIRLGLTGYRIAGLPPASFWKPKTPPGFDKNRFWTETFQVATIARTLD